MGNEYQVSFALLPIELVSFRASLTDENTVLLAWQTASEQNNQGFEIQRSGDGLAWKNIGFVAGAGTTTEEQYYSFVDRPNASGIFYYRLRQMDFDGGVDFSPIRSVEFNSLDSNFRIYPNPIIDRLNVELENDWRGELTLRMVNMLGQEVYINLFSKNIEIWNEKIDLSRMPGGIYQMMISDGEKMIVRPFLK